MSEGENGGASGGRRALTMGIIYTVGIMGLGLGIVFAFGADKRGPATFVYIFHALFYSACLAGLLACMFHAAEEH